MKTNKSINLKILDKLIQTLDVQYIKYWKVGI